MKLTAISLMAAAVLGVASCSTKSTEAAQSAQYDSETAIIPLNGTHNIVAIAVSEDNILRPADLQDAEQPLEMVFSDSTFSAHTNCNTIFGGFSRNGNRIKIENPAMTRMACPDMRMEDMLTQVLPEVISVDTVSGPYLRLNTAGEAYILLSPAK